MRRNSVYVRGGVACVECSKWLDSGAVCYIVIYDHACKDA